MGCSVLYPYLTPPPVWIYGFSSNLIKANVKHVSTNVQFMQLRSLLSHSQQVIANWKERCTWVKNKRPRVQEVFGLFHQGGSYILGFWDVGIPLFCIYLLWCYFTPPDPYTPALCESLTGKWTEYKKMHWLCRELKIKKNGSVFVFAIVEMNRKLKNQFN